MDLHATGQFGFDPVNEIVRFTGKHPQLVGTSEDGMVMTFQMLELAYLASRNIVLQKSGIVVQQLQGGPSAPTNGHAPVPRGGDLRLHTEH